MKIQTLTRILEDVACSFLDDFGRRVEEVTANVEEKVRKLELGMESAFEGTLKSPDETSIVEEGVASARQGKSSVHDLARCRRREHC